MPVHVVNRQGITITGEAREGSGFRLTTAPGRQAASTFIALLPGEARVTRRLADLLDLDDAVPAIAHWHGQYRTDAFATSIGELRGLAEAWR